MTDWEAYRIAVYEDATGAAAASKALRRGGQGPLEPARGRRPVSEPLGPHPRSRDRPLAKGEESIHRGRSDAGDGLYDALIARIQPSECRGAPVARSCGFTRAQVDLIFSDGLLNDTNQRGSTAPSTPSQRGNTGSTSSTQGARGTAFYGADSDRPGPGTSVVINMEKRSSRPQERIPGENTVGRRSGTPTTLGAWKARDPGVSVYYLPRLPAGEFAGRQVAWLEVKGFPARGEGEARRGIRRHPPVRSRHSRRPQTQPDRGRRSVEGPDAAARTPR